ncbi:MAG: VCBS repeat-containing protein [Bdellovibrionales bacterium]|nr:VCBS repeat-containing protein [Bdellovibrionales bacterium]
MPLTLGSNIASLKTIRTLDSSQRALGAVFERLSSGQRINRASDDAAGLAIASTLDAGAKIFSQGVRNINDGISLLNTADAALEQITQIVTRLSELAEQAANGSLGSSQRQALDAEAQELAEEYFRISKSTKFNGLGLLDDSFDQIRFQGGLGVDGGILSSLGGALADGTFQSSATFDAATTNALEVEGVDLNGDGNIDLITGGNGALVTVAFGNGDGTFAEAATIDIGTGQVRGLQIGDLDDDGDIDFVGFTANGEVSVYTNDGSGTFTQTQSFTNSIQDGRELALADLNGDGALDVISIGQASTPIGGIHINFGNGDGTFDQVTSVAITDASANRFVSIAVGDLNGDGALDFALGGIDGSSQSYIAAYEGDGDGGFVQTLTGSLPASGELVGLTITDLTGDGQNDLFFALGGQGGVYYAPNEGAGSFIHFGVLDSSNSNATLSLAYEDVNGDGIEDIIQSDDAGQIVTYLGDGEGGFAIYNTLVGLSGDANDLALVDADNDGVLDILAAESTGSGDVGVYTGHSVSGVNPLFEFSLESRSGALAALSQFEHKLDQLTTQRGEIGAFQSRLSSATRILKSSTENYRAAESRIRDADIATEAAALVRLQILSQASTAVLAQANQQPQIALQLLSGDSRGE